MRRSSPSNNDRLARTVIVAESVFGERSIDLIGEPQWIVAVITRDWSFMYLRAALNERAIAIFGTLNVIFWTHRWGDLCFGIQ